MSRSRLGAALMLAVVALSWGAIPLIVRGDVPWEQLLAARLWLGALTLLAVVGLGGMLRRPQGGDRWRLGGHRRLAGRVCQQPWLRRGVARYGAQHLLRADRRAR